MSTTLLSKVPHLMVEKEAPLRPPSISSGDLVSSEHVLDFLATMAHELRNPMTPILGQVHLLRRLARDEGPLPEKFIRGLDRLEAAVEVFMRRATTLLDVSRIASGRIELHPTAVDLSAARHWRLWRGQTFVSRDLTSL
jgi:signal transduction histidine kinase